MLMQESQLYGRNESKIQKVTDEITDKINKIFFFFVAKERGMWVCWLFCECWTYTIETITERIHEIRDNDQSLR